MARRRRRTTSTAEDIVELIALCPWWVGVAAAVLAHLALHAAAVAPPASPTAAGPVHIINVTMLFVKTLAGFGQYVLPGLFLFGAGLSAMRRESRRRLKDEAARRGAAQGMRGEGAAVDADGTPKVE